MSTVSFLQRNTNNAAKFRKFGGVFGATKDSNKYAFFGSGGWAKNYTPTANAFINELKHRTGNAPVTFTLKKVSGTLGNVGYPLYEFTGTFYSDNNELNAKSFLQGYLNFYFNRPELTTYLLESAKNTSVNATGSVYTKRIFNFPNSNAIQINANDIKAKIESLGYSNVLVVGRSDVITVTANIPSNVSNLDAQAKIQKIINNVPLLVGGGNTAAILRAAQTYANQTGVTLDKAISVVTSNIPNAETIKDIIGGAAGVGADAAKNTGDFFDKLITNDFVKKFALSLGISAGLALLLMFAGGAVFLKVYTSK